MRDQQQQMIDAQAQQISSLRHALEEAVKARFAAEDKYQAVKLNAKFYSIMQQAIGENESLQSAWDQFLVMLKLIKPEVEQEFASAAAIYGNYMSYVDSYNFRP